jgi:site-specific DNA recombinase
LRRLAASSNGLIDVIAEGFVRQVSRRNSVNWSSIRPGLESEIDGAPAAAPRLHPNLAELYRKKVANLQDALADSGTQMEALEILRGLIERVNVGTDKNASEIELVGEIANMVRLSAGSESLGNEPYRSSLKVVAGVGFEPTTFRL